MLSEITLKYINRQRERRERERENEWVSMHVPTLRKLIVVFSLFLSFLFFFPSGKCRRNNLGDRRRSLWVVRERMKDLNNRAAARRESVRGRPFFSRAPAAYYLLKFMLALVPCKRMEGEAARPLNGLFSYLNKHFFFLLHGITRARVHFTRMKHRC